MTHTNEPWLIHHNQPTFLRANGGRKHIGNTDSMGEKETNEANARRIVACVNACAGISTENLEKNRPMVWLAQQYNEMIRQRDELFAAIETTLDENGHLADGDNCTLIALKRVLSKVGAGRGDAVG